MLPDHNGFIPVYEVLRELGVTKPGWVWKKLLQDPALPLPEHTMKQFAMRDGRKGRFTPAVRLEHQQQLLDLLQKAGLIQNALQAFPPMEHSLLLLLCRAFADLAPQPHGRLGHHTFDLYFCKARLVVHFWSPFRSTPPLAHTQQHLQEVLFPLGVQGLLIDPYQKGFEPGDCVFMVRQKLGAVQVD